MNLQEHLWGGHEGDEKIGESTNNVLVGVFGVESEIAEEELVQDFPIGSDVHELGTRLHHLLH